MDAVSRLPSARWSKVHIGRSKGHFISLSAQRSAWALIGSGRSYDFAPPSGRRPDPAAAPCLLRHEGCSVLLHIRPVRWTGHVCLDSEKDSKSWSRGGMTLAKRSMTSDDRPPNEATPSCLHKLSMLTRHSLTSCRCPRQTLSRLQRPMPSRRDLSSSSTIGNIAARSADEMHTRLEPISSTSTVKMLRSPHLPQNRVPRISMDGHWLLQVHARPNRRTRQPKRLLRTLPISHGCQHPYRGRCRRHTDL